MSRAHDNTPKQTGNTYTEGTDKDKGKERSTQRRTFNRSGYSEDAKDIVPEKIETGKKKRTK